MKPFPADIQELINTIYRGTNQRNTAFEKLTARKDGESTRALLRLLEDYRVPPFYVAIIDELAQRGKLDPMPYFRNILQSRSTTKTHINNQLTVVDTLARYGEQASTISLLTYTLNYHSDPYILSYCVHTLGKIGTEEAVYVLSSLIQQHEDSRVRHDAIMALGTSRHPRAVDVLLNYLESEATVAVAGELNPDAVNAVNSLLRLWKAEVHPFNLERWLQVLTNWLYSDTSEHPKSVYTLRAIALPQAEAIIRCWEQSIVREERFFC